MKNILKFVVAVLVAAGLGLGISVLALASAPENTPFMVQDDATGRIFPVLIGGSWPTTPGLCTDDDHGFKPFKPATITIKNPHDHSILTFSDTSAGTFAGEYFCGDEATIDGVHYNKLAFIGWYDTSGTDEK